MSDQPSGGWCTNWSAYNTPRLWAMVEGEDNPEAWKQVNAWREISGAVDLHLEQLTAARDALAAAWPPAQNDSSAAFITEVNTLIARMKSAREDASVTSTALDGILRALSEAKANIEPLWHQYREKSDDVVPAWWDKAEEELDTKARAHMVNAEQIVQQNLPSIRIPLPYEFVPPSGRREGDPTLNVDGDLLTGSQSSFRHDPPPPMPDRAPLHLTNFGVSAGSVPLLPGDVRVGSPAPVHFFNPEVPTARPPSGPALSEMAPLPPAPSPNPWLPPGSPSNGIPPVTPIPDPGALPIGGGRGLVPSTKPSVVGLRPFTSGSKVAMPPGVIIGTTPLGKSLPNEVGPGPRAAVKPTTPAWLPGGTSQSGTSGVGMVPGNGRQGANGEDKDFRFAPDNPWSVAKGVPPVIEPTLTAAVHDAGIEVIGKTR